MSERGVAALSMPLALDASSLRRTLARTEVVALVAVLLVALVVRVAWASAVQPDPRDGRFDDSVWYHHTARLMADGDGYVNYAERTPTALWAPGYPVALAALFRLPGDDVAAGRALNVAAGLVLVAGVYYLASRLWDARAGLFAAGIMAFFPSPIYFSSLLMTEVPFTAMAVVLLCLACALTLRAPPARWHVVALGVVAGAVGMLRPEGSFLALAVVGTWLLVYRSWRRTAEYTALLVLGMAVLFVPWTVRNAVQLDAPVVGTTGMGQVLIQGHNEDAGGRPDLYAVTELWARFEDVPFPEREVRINNAGIRDSAGYAVRHIPRELTLVPHRLAWFFRGDDSVIFWLQNAGPGEAKPFSGAWEDRWSMVADVYYYAVAGAMVLGLPFWLRRIERRHALIIGPFAVYTLMWALFFVGDARYHFPLLPVFTVLAAIGLSAFVATARERLGGRAT